MYQVKQVCFGSYRKGMRKMKCPNCNAEVSDNMKFCAKCGTKIEPVSRVVESEPETPKQEETSRCIKCGAELKKGTKFCAKCGASQVAASKEESEPETPKQEETSKCIKCGAELKKGAKFCAKCGTSQVAEPKNVSNAALSQPQAPQQAPVMQQPQAPQQAPVMQQSQAPQQAPIMQQNYAPKKKKSPVGIIVVVAIVLIVAVIAVVLGWSKLKDVLGIEDKIADIMPWNTSENTEASAETDTSKEPETGENHTENAEASSAEGEPAEVKGDPALLDAVDEKVTAAEKAFDEGAYKDAIAKGTDAIAEYVRIADENNLKQEARAKIVSAFQNISKSAIAYCNSMEQQELAPALYAEISNTVQPVLDLAESLKEQGYTIDTSVLTDHYDGLVPKFRDFYIKKINDITKLEQWSRDEAWTYASQAYSIQDGEKPLLVDESDLDDPLRLRYAYSYCWISRKRCEKGVADGSMSNEEAFDQMVEILPETDYNLLTLDAVITYGTAAGKDVTKYQTAYDDIVDKLKEQGITIVDNGGSSTGTTIDVTKFWYFNDLDGVEKYKVNQQNGSTKETREWIRQNIPETIE